jgi:tripartite-type tricarboxylate transporter receptor subunit TctC
MFMILRAALLALGLAGAQAAQADDFPSKPLKIVVIVAPGGSADGVARLVAEGLGTRMGQPVVVENRPGAGGNIATQTVARAEPDGYTLLLSANNHTINPTLFANAGYSIDELVPVAQLMEGPSVFAVAADSRFKSLQDVIDEARRKPGSISFGSAGVGIPNHIAGEMLKRAAGINLSHVPYRGSGPAMVDAIAGHVPMVSSSLVAAMPHLQSGKLRALAVTSAKRWPSAPDIPAAAESGLPGYEHMTWLGLFAPKGVPGDVVAKLNKEVNAVLALPDVREKVRKLGGDVSQKDQAAFDAMIKQDFKESSALVKEAGLKAD